MGETIHERIRCLVDTLAQGKNTVFALKLGVSEANIRGYTKGIMPKADILEKIVISYDINPMWLLTGKGQPIEQSKDVVEELPLSFMDKIIEQAEEIGRLKEQIRQMEKEKENDVQGAQTSSIANVG